MNRTLGFLVLCGLTVTTGSLVAHHSLAGVYDMHKEIEKPGSVVDVKFTNPHGSLGVAVANTDGSMTKWVLTMGSATSLASKGIGKTGPNAIKTGDQIKIKFLPAKDGSPLGFLRSVTLPDGRVINVSGGE